MSMLDASVHMIVFVTTGRAARHGSIASRPETGSAAAIDTPDITPCSRGSVTPHQVGAMLHGRGR
jgi:hypothetical protein